MFYCALSLSWSELKQYYRVCKKHLKLTKELWSEWNFYVIFALSSTVDGYLSDWSDWTVCSQTCGWGQQTRSRDCHPPQYGGSLCQEDTTDKKACHIKPCPGIRVFKITQPAMFQFLFNLWLDSHRKLKI